ncbi:hypothetical protein DFH06DRAFT_1488854 [Mycena polygramma]|nr:hypothetical protein DFH06DRAFT_1488854 [Mycena polygramma]
MKTLLVTFLSAAAFAISLASEVDNIETKPEPCTIRASVRAEDLAPDRISQGELRIKVLRLECADQVASVALRLQFDEFGEVKFLRKGAVLPDVQPSNQSMPTGYTDWLGSDVVYDYQALDNALSDPEFWAVKAEERRAWATEAILLENNPDLSQPIIVPFTVAVPAVNYPPAAISSRMLYGPVSRHAFTDLDYRYTAIVTFTDGRTKDVLAGHTTFVPSALTVPEKTPFTWNTTFALADSDQCGTTDSPVMKKRAEELENCLPAAQHSKFVAEITLEDGNTVQTGRQLKGRVTVRSIKDGSTTMSSIVVLIKPLAVDHWAQAQAAAGGDAQFFNVTSGVCQRSGGFQALDSQHGVFAWDEPRPESQPPRLSTGKSPLTPAHPHFDFQLDVPHDTPIDFTSYYANTESVLQLQLTVLYAPEVADCVHPDSQEELAADDDALTEEGMWDPYTPLGQPLLSNEEWVSNHEWRRSLRLQASVPITVVHSTPPLRAVEHYLTPGSTSPILLRGAHAEPPASFYVVQPVVTVEAPADTAARLLQPGSTDPAQWRQQFFSRATEKKYPDPTKYYRRKGYAGMLWRKKVVAEERGILPLPLRAEIVADGDSNSQQRLSVAP